MERVLVTGADGFIGSHLAEFLVEKGYEVRALTQYNSFNSWGWLDESVFSKDMDIRSGDIRDAEFCHKLVEDIDTVFHLAALIAIPFSYQAPASYVETNIGGTLNLLNAGLRHEVKAFLQTSTSEVYGSARFVPINESHPLQPQSPYSASKIGADALAQSYYNAFEMPVALVRPFNTFGPRQSARAVIPTVITQIANGQTSLKLGDTSPTRDFNFVTDTCRGFEMIAREPKALGQVLNLGSGAEISIGDTVSLIADLMGASIEIEVDQQRIRPEKSEVNRLLCDRSLAEELVGYSPKWSLKDGLKETIEWFSNKDNLKKYKATIYNV